MANLTWPSVAIPRDFVLSQYSKVIRNSAIFGRSGQNIDLLNDRWLVGLQISAKYSDEASVLESFVNKLKAGANTVEIYHFGRPTVAGTLLSDLVVTSATQGTEILTATVATGSTLKAGDMLGVGGLLVQVALDCVSVSNQILIPMTMRLRKSVNSGTVIVTSQPTARFRLKDSTSVTYGPNATIQGLGLDFAEDIP